MTPLPWSHSSLEKFKTCPRQFYETKVAKSVVELPGEEAIWGNRLHAAFEKVLKYGGQLPVELAGYQNYINQIARFTGDRYVEHRLGVRRDLSACDFAAPDVWSRSIVDVLVVRGDSAFILDHKTGKTKPSTQLMLNSLHVFAAFPEVSTCHTVFYWLKNDTMTPGLHHRQDIPAMWAQYEQDLRNYEFAFKNNVWTEKHSGLCNGWCPVKSCQFWREKRRK